MDKKSKKKFMRLAFAGLIVGRAVPMVASPANIESNVDAALQTARAEQQLSMQDIEALSGADIEEETVALY
jgi:hypothetical protein